MPLRLTIEPARTSASVSLQMFPRVLITGGTSRSVEASSRGLASAGYDVTATASAARLTSLLPALKRTSRVADA